MSGTPRLLLTLFPNHGKPVYLYRELHPQNNCTQTRSRSVQHAMDTKFATKNSRSLSTSVLQRSALQFVLWMQLCHISSGVCHDSISTYLMMPGLSNVPYMHQVFLYHCTLESALMFPRQLRAARSGSRSRCRSCRFPSIVLSDGT